MIWDILLEAFTRSGKMEELNRMMDIVRDARRKQLKYFARMCKKL